MHKPGAHRTPMSFVHSIPYYVWLAFALVPFAVGEYFSKKFALAPNGTFVAVVVFSYALGGLLWLPAILQKNQLSIVGAMWSVASFMITVLIGVLVFGERLSPIGLAGLGFGFVAITLLSVA